jgi:hypothetical protein
MLKQNTCETKEKKIKEIEDRTQKRDKTKVKSKRSA